LSEHRQCHLTQFYKLLDRLEVKLGGERKLSKCSGRIDWPQRGVYFFREAGECRKETGDGPRIVRVGTHALIAGSKTTLWNRLYQHRGVASHGGGDHRGSIFRSLVGSAMIEKHEYDWYPKWGKGSNAPKSVKEREHPLEQEVSAVIGAMPFLWLAMEDASLRGCIERNSIALLSNYNGQEPIDPPSPDWLGCYSDRERVRLSGLWNNNHVGDDYDPVFLDTLERLIEK